MDMFTSLLFKWNRKRTYSWLRHTWREDTHLEGLDSVEIKRRIQPMETCVDLYWVVKPKNGCELYKKTFDVSRRCDWSLVKDVIARTEDMIRKGDVY